MTYMEYCCWSIFLFLEVEHIDFSEINFNAGNLNQTKSMIAIRIKNNKKDAITQSPFLIDRCCKPFIVEPNVLNMSSIKDRIPRAPCNMSSADFLFKYVQKRKAVILRGCQKTWRARKWTVEGIF